MYLVRQPAFASAFDSGQGKVLSNTAALAVQAT